MTFAEELFVQTRADVIRRSQERDQGLSANSIREKQKLEKGKNVKLFPRYQPSQKINVATVGRI